MDALTPASKHTHTEFATEALWTLKGMFAGMPFVGYLVGALILRRFALDEAEHERVRAALDARSGLGRA